MARFEEIMMFLPWIALIIGSISEPIGIQSLWKITQEICYHFTIKRNKKNKTFHILLIFDFVINFTQKKKPSIHIHPTIYFHPFYLWTNRARHPPGLPATAKRWIRRRVLPLGSERHQVFWGDGSIYIVIRRSMHAECMYNICLICLFKSHIVFFQAYYTCCLIVCVESGLHQKINQHFHREMFTYSTSVFWVIIPAWCQICFDSLGWDVLFLFFYCRPIINYNWRYNKKSVLLEAPVRNQLNSSISI